MKMRHNFQPSGGMAENPGVWDVGNGGLQFVAECECGVRREMGKDTTGVRPGNDWGPRYFDSKGIRQPNAGECRRKEEKLRLPIADDTCCDGKEFHSSN